MSSKYWLLWWATSKKTAYVSNMIKWKDVTNKLRTLPKIGAGVHRQELYIILLLCDTTKISIILISTTKCVVINPMFQNLWGNSFYTEKYNNMVDGCVKKEDSIEKKKKPWNVAENSVPGKVISYFNSKLDDRIKILLIIWLKCYLIFSPSVLKMVAKEFLHRKIGMFLFLFTHW